MLIFRHSLTLHSLSVYQHQRSAPIGITSSSSTKFATKPCKRKLLVCSASYIVATGPRTCCCHGNRCVA